MRALLVLAVCALCEAPGRASAHGGDALALEARLHESGLDLITYVGQRPVQRELRNPPSMPLAALPQAQLRSRLTERVVMRTRVRTAREACERGPLLRMEPDPDGQALRLLHRYRCQGALEPGLRVQFDPLPEQRARTFVYGAFYAGRYRYVHTFVGREATLDPARFSQPIRAGELAHLTALFPPLPPAPVAGSPHTWPLTALASLLGLAGLVWAARVRRRRLADSSSYAQ
ncbi:MAG TPA: hypothetical protein VFZ61_19375 [Polyangiales bacterium]